MKLLTIEHIRNFVLGGSKIYNLDFEMFQNIM